MPEQLRSTKRPGTLGAYIREQRERIGISQRQLASIVGVHHSNIARLENGEVGDRPKPEYLQSLANALGVDVSKLLAYLGVTPKLELPSVRTYFRRKLGVLRQAMGPVIAAALADKGVVEVMVNPDGKIWIDKIGEGRSFTGKRLEPDAADRILRLLADHVGEVVTKDRPRISATLPETGERFQASSCRSSPAPPSPSESDRRSSTRSTIMWTPV